MPRKKKDDLSIADVATFLLNYTEYTADSRMLKLGDKVCYFLFDQETQKSQFKRGGHVLINDKNSDYIGLIAGSFSWFLPRVLCKFWIHKPVELSASETRRFRRQIEKLKKITG